MEEVNCGHFSEPGGWTPSGRRSCFIAGESKHSGGILFMTMAAVASGLEGYFSETRMAGKRTD